MHPIFLPNWGGEDVCLIVQKIWYMVELGCGCRIKEGTAEIQGFLLKVVCLTVLFFWAVVTNYHTLGS